MEESLRSCKLILVISQVNELKETSESLTASGIKAQLNTKVTLVLLLYHTRIGCDLTIFVLTK